MHLIEREREKEREIEREKEREIERERERASEKGRKKPAPRGGSNSGPELIEPILPRAAQLGIHFLKLSQHTLEMHLLKGPD